MQRWARSQVLAAADAALSAGGIGAVSLLEAGRRPLVELLVPRRHARQAAQALDGLPWRWRYGGAAERRAATPVAWTFDGGALLQLHSSLPESPWAPATMRPLRRLLLEVVPPSGIRPAFTSAQIVRLAADAARRGLRHPQLLEELNELLERPGAQDWPVLARRAGLAAPAERAVAAAVAGPMDAPGDAGPPRGHLVDRGLSRLLPRDLDARRRGEPLALSVARCRFGGLELLAGRGVFLPRGVSEALLGAALAALVDRRQRATLVDVGTGCGAVALAAASHRPGTVVVGTEVDKRAADWALRNSRRLGIPLSVHVGSLLEPLPPSLLRAVDVVCGNVPCVPSAAFSPAADAASAAYVGEGDDGLGLQRRLAMGARDVLVAGGALVLQMAPAQWDVLGPELRGLGYVVDGAHGDGVAVVGTAIWQGAAGG